jgi:hypothetical protein
MLFKIILVIMFSICIFSVLFAVFLLFDAGADAGAGAGAGYLQKVHGEDVEVVEDVGEGEGGEFVVVEEGEGFEDE